MLLSNEQMGEMALSIMRADGSLKNEPGHGLHCVVYVSREAEISQGKARDFLYQLSGKASNLNEVEMQEIALKFSKQRVSNFLDFLLGQNPLRELIGGSYAQKKCLRVKKAEKEVQQKFADRVKRVGFSDEIAMQFVQQIFGSNAS